MDRSLKGLLVVALFSASALVHAQSPWSAQDYDLYPGDFNGDGLTDMLYIAKDPAHLNGIVLSDGTALNTPLQTWDNAYLGIPWTGGVYTITVADFNGDGKADLFLQRTTPGDHFLLLTDDTGVTAISQTVANDAAGLIWSADQHRLVAADFNGDGKADLFFQPTDAKGLSAVVLADSNGQFTAKAPDQSWNDGYEGLYWATTESAIFAGDFNGDGLGDLLVQAQPTAGTGPGTLLPAQFVPNANGVTLVQASKQIFALEGVQAWSQGGFSANWSPLASAIVVGDFNADGRSDVLLQGQSAKDASYLLYGKTPGAIFTDASAMSRKLLPTADSFRPIVGHFTNDKRSGLYFQSMTPDQPNFIGSVAGSTLSVTQADASLPVPTDSGTGLTSAPPAAGGAAAPATLTVTSTGRTPGQFSVTPTGAAAYQIPIWVPPGPRGIQPSLAIVYNSQSGDGILGLGWNLAGLSSISRCTKTYAQDTTPVHVALITTDGYCLNGNRLRLTAGTYGTSGSTYQTELADFSLITASGTSGNGPAAFIVKGKDGLTYEYGNTTDSRILYGSTAGQWLLNKVSDRSGNNYIVAYGTGAAGSAAIGVPITISYTPTSHGASTYKYSVAFVYGTKASQAPGTIDPAIVGYVNGVQVTNTNLLLSISVSSGALLERKYILSYGAAPTTTRARLTSVQECGGSAGTDCLSPTTMTYQDGQLGISSTSNTAVSSAPNNYVYGKYDFNGDGYADILYLNGTTWNVAFGSATGYGTPVSTGAANYEMFGDFRGEGKDGLLAVNGSTWWYYTWNGTAFVGVTTGLAADSAMAVADINGDGLPDLVYFSTVYGTNGSVTIQTRLNTSSGGTVSFSSTLNNAYTLTGSIGSAKLLMPTLPYLGSLKSWDFDGDGRQDLALQWKDTSVVPAIWNYDELVSNGTGFGDNPVGNGTASLPAKVQFVQWNDDACTDVEYGSTLFIADCGGNAGSSLTVPGTVLATLDWNGDGHSDILVVNGSTIGVYLSTGTGLAGVYPTTIPYTSTCNYYGFDANGDGLDDLMCWDQLGSTVVKYYLHNGAGTRPDLIASITDGYGVAESPSYVSIVQGSYTKGSGAVFPDQDYIGPQYVTKLVNLTDGISASGTYSQTYTYTNARQNLQGRGFEGFQSRKVVDSRTSAPVRISYFLNGQNTASRFPLTGMVYQDDVLQSNGTTVISSNVISNASTTLDNTANNQRYFPHIASSTLTQNEVGGTKNGLPITQTATIYTFDSYGNATTVAETVTDKDAGSPYLNSQWLTTTTTSVPTFDTTNWCVGLPTQVQVVKSATGVTPITRTVSYTPDYVNCREKDQTFEPSSATYKVTETFLFDSFGNINSDAIAGVGMTARTTLIAWSDATHTTGQFPVTITNALSQPTQRDYNYDKGVQANETDPNGILTTWNTDNFARRILESRPDGTSTVTTYNACASVPGGCQNGDPASGVTSINKMVVIATQKDSGGVVIRDDLTYQDQFDRTIVTKTKTLTGGYSRVGTQFDALGRVYRQTAPCDAVSCTVYWTTNYYDALNRLTQQQRPISASNSTLQTTTIAYLGRTTTYTDPQSKVTTRITKVNGAMGRSQDHNGYYQNFGHDAFGSLLSITDSLSNTLFSATYDYGLAAFQRTTSDMDLGARSYAYNALGEITSYSDANGQNFTFGAFDALGRPSTRTEPDLTTTWTWGNTATSHNIGRLASVTAVGPQTYSEAYLYDTAGRLSRRTMQGSDFDVAYNTLGSIDTLTYPVSTNACRVVAKYGYQNGVLKTITDASNSGACGSTGTVYWTATSQSPRGQITQETLGNNVVINRAFDSVTGWLSSITAGAGGGSVLQNQTYAYDLLGNVTQRQDGNAGLTESICYDNVYRMDHTTATGLCTDAATLQMTYDAMGNITSRSDLAAGNAWTYSTTHKHQVLQAGNTLHTYTYDNNGNAITRNGSSVSWTSYNLPITMTASGGYSSSFNYGQDHQKWLQQYSGPSGFENTTYFDGMLEKVDNGTFVDWRHYIFAGGEQVAIYSRKSSGVNTVRYTLEDHQGSPSAILPSTANPTAPIINESFEPYGGRRDPATWSGSASQADLNTINFVTRQGFTGQTMLGNLGLIHMNGRVLDSVTGRFLSADPYITEPGNTQNFNRYGYVYNNPLSYIDPSGFDGNPLIVMESPCDGGGNCGVDIKNYIDPNTGLPPEEVTVTGTRPSISSSSADFGLGSWLQFIFASGGSRDRGASTLGAKGGRKTPKQKAQGKPQTQFSCPKSTTAAILRTLGKAATTASGYVGLAGAGLTGAGALASATPGGQVVGFPAMAAGANAIEDSGALLTGGILLQAGGAIIDARNKNFGNLVHVGVTASLQALEGFVDHFFPSFTSFLPSESIDSLTDTAADNVSSGFSAVTGCP